MRRSAGLYGTLFALSLCAWLCGVLPPTGTVAYGSPPPAGAASPTSASPATRVPTAPASSSQASAYPTLAAVPAVPVSPTPPAVAPAAATPAAPASASGGVEATPTPIGTTTEKRLPAEGLPEEERLSDERTYTRWAHPRRAGAIHSLPSSRAPVVARLRLRTEDGERDTYVLLKRARASSERSWWVEVRVPGRPNGRVGWVASRDLGAVHLTHWALQVSISLERVTLLLDGRPVWSAPAGVGEASTPTPTGHFWVRELLQVAGETLYGPFAFGTGDYSVLSDWPHGGVVGIHGTNQPQLIPGHPSHGCIRLRNADIVYLAHHLPVGAPVDIVG